MATSLYIINPGADFPTYLGAEVVGASGFLPAVMMADLATTTVAALAPPDFDVAVCDESIAPVDYDHPAEWIAITGKVSQRGRMAAIAAEFRRRGKKIIIGGPFASLSPGRVEHLCDVLVCGEIEEIAADLFADLRAGAPKRTYQGGRVDMARTPVPRWDLYPNQRALMAQVQTSRGCPFECEFCDVIQYVGRKQRHKPIATVLAELDLLYSLGYRYALLADDNFTAYRSRCKALLRAIAEWRRDHRMDFVTQISIDAARDEELLDLLVAAGVTQVFVGIETPNVDSLRETGKRQNLKIDLAAEVQKLIDFGLSVTGGMIVGFDADGPDVFQQQFDFAMRTAVPIFTLGALTASDATPLYARVSREGRLTSDVDVIGSPWGTNIAPIKMTQQELRDGLKRLCNELYAPDAFAERVLRFIDTYGRARKLPPPQSDMHSLREIDKQCLQIAMNVRRMGSGEMRAWNRIWRAAASKPETTSIVTRMLVQYAQVRHMFEQGRLWDTHPVEVSPSRERLPETV